MGSKSKEMTLQEAIDHLEETLSDPNHEWNCLNCKREHEQLLEWLNELQTYRKIASDLVKEDSDT